ncbi:YicC/YloC family endoribonuclease [Hoeflea sp. TYP-13]|uniref:YicC/YloC family endoribonuclease n=1 Tax=Hoeflea sp. TYP-13 TaxID=3230023 RepID=UPI0034C64BEF
MTLQSMTGFAHKEGTAGSLQWTWELRSVNGRGLDIRIRVPAGFEQLEPDIKKALSDRFSRGNIQATLSVSRDEKRAEATVNQDVLDAVVDLAKQLQDSVDAEPPRIDGLLNIRGVLEFNEPQLDEETARLERSAVMDGLDEAIGAMAEMRKAEGTKIAEFISAQIDGIEAMAKKADSDPSTEPENIVARLSAQVKMLLDTGVELDEGRLHMEAAILASKADIREEIDRLFAHVDACRALVADGGVVGRRLDFLAQEFNRESNTICSKSNASSVTAVGLDLKVLIDQFREQIQNLE